uniref:PHR domain-containing protein n=1 Tax=Meloidogyne hapla TaxID=6305 RepID=A0A1I8BLW2_MELHA
KLAECVSDEELAVGCLYPDLKKVPEISIKIAVAIGEECYKDGSAKLYPEPEDKELFVRAQVYNTDYEEVLPLEMNETGVSTFQGKDGQDRVVVELPFDENVTFKFHSYRFGFDGGDGGRTEGQIPAIHFLMQWSDENPPKSFI